MADARCWQQAAHILPSLAHPDATDRVFPVKFAVSIGPPTPVPTLDPVPAINNASAAEVNTTAGSAAVFNNNGTECPGNCTTLWSLTCPGGRGAFANRTGDAIAVTTGGNNSYDVNTAGAGGGFSCESGGARGSGQPSHCPHRHRATC